MTFTIAPLIGAVAPFDIGFDSHRGTIIWAVVSLAVVVATVIWARDTMMRSTLFNRRIATTASSVSRPRSCCRRARGSPG